MKRVVFLFTLVFVVFVAFSKTAYAGYTKETKYVDNVFGNDYKHVMYHYDTEYHYMSRNLTGWILKDSYADVVLQYGDSATGTIGYTITSENEISASVLEGAIGASSKISQSLSYSYSETVMRSFTWTITPSTPGKYHAISINSVKTETKIDTYLQEFKWFGQGDYKFKETNYVEVPVMEYKARVYKYSATGDVYSNY